MKKEPAITRFWRKVRKTKTCWIWTDHTGKRGTGIIWISGKPISAHIFAYEQFIGPIPDGLYICHHCDNPKCVNPKHLFAGTQNDNMQDMKRKKRANHPLGEANGRAVLTEANVREIRAFCKPWSKQHGQVIYAKKFGVTVTAIQDVLKRKRWSHVI
jgi:hypothetical protein